MAGTNVAGGPPSVQETLRTMNQSMGQIMTFVQQNKQLAEMKREFDLGAQALETRQRQTDTMDVVQSIGKRYGGLNLAAKDMGDDLTKLLESGGFDPLLANNITNALANTPADLDQHFYTTTQRMIALPNDSPMKQQWLAEMGGEMGAPDVRTGVYAPTVKVRGIVDQSLDGLIEGDLAAGEEGVTPGTGGTTPPEDTGTTLAEDKAALEAAAKLEAKAGQAPPRTLVEPPDRIEGLRGEMADKVQERLDQKRKGELINALQQDDQSKVTGSKFILNKQGSGQGVTYTDQMGKQVSPEYSPEANERTNIETFGNPYPRNDKEFNSITNPTSRDKANLSLSQSMNGVTSEQAEGILNIMNTPGPKEPLRDAATLQDYVAKQRDNQRRAQAGTIPPTPKIMQQEEEIVLAATTSLLNTNSFTSLPNYIARRASDIVARDATSPEAMAKLQEDLDTIIAISKNPALATYYMPTVEANRIENRKLNLEEQRLIANRDITMTNEYLGTLNWLTAMASSGGGEGNGKMSDVEKIFLGYARDRHETITADSVEAGLTEQQYIEKLKQDPAALGFDMILNRYMEGIADVDIQKTPQKTTYKWYQFGAKIINAATGSGNYVAPRIIDPTQQRQIPQVYGSVDNSDPIDLNAFK